VPEFASRLAVDLSGGLIRVLDGALGGPMRCGSGGTPAGALTDGRVSDVTAVGAALRQLLARTEIQETRALIAASDAVATFRVLKLPPASTDHAVDAAVTKELPMDPQRMATSWIDLHTGQDERVVYAVAWDRVLVKNITDAAKVAGLEPIAVDLKSACIARTVAAPSCVVLDMSSDPMEILLIDGHVPQVWQTVRLGGQIGDGIGPALAAPLRSVLRFYKRRRDTEFGSTAPILISGEQMLSSQVTSSLAETLDHPVQSLPIPARVTPDVRYPTYLTCLGLIMRRT
jgi:hypothetical protein